ncbi:MAG: hypothetical protein WD154_00005, partial [Nitrosopumilaceae archaeon]
MGIFKINDEGELPSLAEMLYKAFSVDAIYFMIDANQKLILFVDELFGKSSSQERELMIKVLKLETIIKYCLLAETLAAISLTFTYSYSDNKKEMVGLFTKISEYEVHQVTDFYEKIKSRDLQYVAKIAGYPPLIMQQNDTKTTLERSCELIRDYLKNIGEFYLEFRLIYNAYKHGYRIFYGKNDSDGSPAFGFIEKKGNQHALVVTDDQYNEILKRSRYSKDILKMILDNHNQRAEYENSGESSLDIKITIMRMPSEKRPAEPTLIWPRRGELAEKEKEEGNVLYEKFKDNLEKDHYGKIVVLDLDSKEILGVEENVESAMTLSFQSNSSGRRSIRKIGDDAKTN